jgi:hypothetical protein
VEISVRPDAHVKGQDKKGDFTGCLKLHFSKASPFDDKSAAYVGAILHEFSKQHGPSPTDCGPCGCMVIDVFNGKMFEAPTAAKKRLKDVQAACKEIATLWPTV